MATRTSRRAGAAALLVLAAPLASAQSPAGRAHDRGAFRVLTWNVSDSAWVRHLDETRAVLRHADADVFAFEQVAPGMGADEVRRLLAGLRGPGDTTWFISVRPADAAIEHTVVASRDSVRELPEFALVEVAADGRLATAGAWPDSVPYRDHYATARAVRTDAAAVRVASSAWVLVAAVHLTCCGDLDDWRELRRQAEAAAIRAALVRAAARVKPAAVVVAGDMNLVHGRAPLDTLLDALRGSRLGPMWRADAMQFDDWTDWTWDGRGTPFNGGRLDNVLYSSATLTVRRARVWDTESLPDDRLRAHGMTAATSKTIGRHRPVVVDFSLARRGSGASGARDTAK